MLNAIRASLGNLASSNDEQDREDENIDEKRKDLGKLSHDNEPGWVMGTITKRVQHCMKSFQQTQIRIDELTQLGWEDATDYVRERYMKSWAAKFNLPAIVKPHIDMTAATPSPKTSGEHMQTFDIF
jgi:hypothetical protein